MPGFALGGSLALFSLLGWAGFSLWDAGGFALWEAGGFEALT